MMYTMQFSAVDLNLIGLALGKLPIEQALPLFSRLQVEAAQQEQAASNAEPAEEAA